MTHPPHRRELDLLSAIVLAAAFSTQYPTAFVSADDLRVVLNNLAFDGILAVGMLLLMIAGGFDLSVGAMASVTGVVCGWLMVRQGWPVAAAVPAALLVSAVGGFVNGVLVAKARLNARITTPGTLGTLQGVAVLVGGPCVTDLPAGFTALGRPDRSGCNCRCG